MSIIFNFLSENPRSRTLRVDHSEVNGRLCPGLLSNERMSTSVIFGPYHIAPGVPTVAEHIALRTAAGLTPPPPQCDVARGLAGSVHCLVARIPPLASSSFTSPQSTASTSNLSHSDSNKHENPSSSNPTNPASQQIGEEDGGEIVGMVRLVGDGAMTVELCDMAVHPAHQGRGLGKQLLDEMLKWVDDNCPYAYLSLLAVEPGVPLYRSRGFTETTGIGMRRARWKRRAELTDTKPVP